MHDDRIARLAGEFLDLDGDAVDDRAFHEVAMDAVGIAAGLPQVAQPRMQRAQMRLHVVRADRGVACPRSCWVVSRCEPVTTNVPPSRGCTGERWAKTATMVSSSSCESRCQPLVGTCQAVPGAGTSPAAGPGVLAVASARARSGRR
jgi:hypothetical protein